MENVSGDPPFYRGSLKLMGKKLGESTHNYLLIGRWEYNQRLDDKSRMSREVHVRICESVGVRFPCATRLVILVDGYKKWDWLVKAVHRRLLEELEKIGIQVNKEKSRIVNLTQGGTFSFLGFEYRRIKTRRGKMGVQFKPRMKARTAFLAKLEEVFRRYNSQPVGRVIEDINPMLRGWVNYFRIGHSSRCFGYIKDWVEKKTRRHLMRAKKLRGFGWKRWSRIWIYETLCLYNDYRVKYYGDLKACPAQ